jgi:DNA repair photolyase
MGLNNSKGNMYDFVTHTFNTVKGKCFHDCGYCYMKRWGQLKEIHFDEKEMKTDLGSGNFIFVGSSNDLFAENIPDEWIFKTLNHCAKYDNKYLFQSKNPKRILDKYLFHPLFIEGKVVVCTTIESNRYYVVMRNAPAPIDRAKEMSSISIAIPTYVTIEPIMDFDLEEMVKTIQLCHPTQVNIGADTGHNHLPEPTKEKVLELIEALNEFTTVKQKNNLKRILG